MAVGPPLVTKINGEEIFTFESGRQEAKIRARDLVPFFGGDIAAPAIMPERGAHTVKISAFPNAGSNIGPNDIVTGLQNGLNVNFSFEQIVAGVLSAIAKNQK